MRAAPSLIVGALATLSVVAVSVAGGSASPAANPSVVATTTTTTTTPTTTTSSVPGRQVSTTTVRPGVSTTTSPTVPGVFVNPNVPVSTLIPRTPYPIPAPFDICESVPSLDVINAQLDEPVTELVELPRGAGVRICEARTDGIDRVQFNRVERSTRARGVALAAGFGAADEYVGPTGGFSYSFAASMLLGDTEWSVHVVTHDTLRDRTRVEAAERSSNLLRAWISDLRLGWPGANTSQVVS